MYDQERARRGQRGAAGGAPAKAAKEAARRARAAGGGQSNARACACACGCACCRRSVVAAHHDHEVHVSSRRIPTLSYLRQRKKDGDATVCLCTYDVVRLAAGAIELASLRRRGGACVRTGRAPRSAACAAAKSLHRTGGQQMHLCPLCSGCGWSGRTDGVSTVECPGRGPAPVVGNRGGSTRGRGAGAATAPTLSEAADTPRPSLRGLIVPLHLYPSVEGEGHSCGRDRPMLARARCLAVASTLVAARKTAAGAPGGRLHAHRRAAAGMCAAGGARRRRRRAAEPARATGARAAGRLGGLFGGQGRGA